MKAQGALALNDHRCPPTYRLNFPSACNSCIASRISFAFVARLYWSLPGARCAVVAWHFNFLRAWALLQNKKVGWALAVLRINAW
jgi:hypothetical protein